VHRSRENLLGLFALAHREHEERRALIDTLTHAEAAIVGPADAETVERVRGLMESVGGCVVDAPGLQTRFAVMVPGATEEQKAATARTAAIVLGVPELVQLSESYARSTGKNGIREAAARARERQAASLYETPRHAAPKAAQTKGSRVRMATREGSRTEQRQLSDVDRQVEAIARARRSGDRPNAA
jgi:hypothetical protein